MDKYNYQKYKQHQSHSNRRIKTQQQQRIDSSTNLSKMMANQYKQQEFRNLKKQFDNFKGYFENNLLKNQLIYEGNKSNSMTTPNLLKLSAKTQSKGKKDYGIKKKHSLEENLRRILQSSLEMEEQQKQKGNKSILNIFQNKLIEMFNNFINPVLINFNKIQNKANRVEQMASRLKYLNHKHHLRCVSTKALLPSEVPLLLDKNIKRRYTQYKLQSRQQQSISTANQDKRILQISLRSMLQQQKSSYDSISKKNRLIDLLVDQIQQLEIKNKTDVDILRQQLCFQQQQHKNIISKLNQQLSLLKANSLDKQYQISQLKAKNKTLNTKYQQIQIEVSKMLQTRMIQTIECSKLKQNIKQLQNDYLQNTQHLQKIKQLQAQTYSLSQKLIMKDKDLEFQKRYGQEQHKSLEKQLKDIEIGFAKIKASNQVLKRKQFEYEKEINDLKKQLKMQRKILKQNSIEEQEYYSLLDKNKVDYDIQELQNKVRQLQKLLQQSQLEKIKLLQQQKTLPVKQLNHNQQMYRSLKEFIVKLQGQIVEKDRRIWLLQNNISRIKSNKPQLPTLFSPKIDRFSSPITRKPVQNISTEPFDIDNGMNAKFIQSVVINQFSLQKYI